MRTFPEYTAAGVLENAQEVGIGYWAGSVKVERDGYGDPVALSITDEDGASYRVDRAQVDKIRNEICDGKYSMADSVRFDIINENNDAASDDVIVQIACFGEIVYG